MLKRLAAQPDPREDAWEALAIARTEGELLSAWLTLLCLRLPGARQAALLMPRVGGVGTGVGSRPGEITFAPVGTWPATPTDLEPMGEVAAAAIRTGTVQQVDPSSEVAGGPGVREKVGLRIAWPLKRNERVIAVLALTLESGTRESLAALSREVTWANAWVFRLVAERQQQGDGEAGVALRIVGEAMAILMRDLPLRQSLIELVHRLAQVFHCSRVAIGLVRGQEVVPTVLSGAAWFDRKAELTTAERAVMEDALDAGFTILVRTDPAAAPSSDRSPGQRLAALSGAREVIAIPLQAGARPEAVLVLERESKRDWSAEQQDLLEALAALVGPAIAHRRRAERGLLALARDRIGKVAERLLGTGHLTWKAGTIAAALFALVLTLVQWPYRITARTVVEGQVEQTVAAPHQGYLREAAARAGDRVRAGEQIARLDDRELKLERSRLQSEIQQSSTRLREALATSEMASYEQLAARLRQNEAELALIESRIERTVIVAPFDGLIISGDLSQRLGAPLEAGEELFRLVPSDAYRVILQVDERDMPYLEATQRGRVLMHSASQTPIAFGIAHVVPLAVSRDGATFFRVEATLEDPPQTIRPGMEGVGKIDVGQRSLGWLASHRIIDWLRIRLWEWLP